MRRRIWCYSAIGWLFAMGAGAARSQPPGNALGSAVGQDSRDEDGWVSAPGSFASSLSQPIPPLRCGLIFYGSGSPLAGAGFGFVQRFGDFPDPRDGRWTPQTMALPNHRLPPAVVAPGGAAPPGGAAALPRFLRRPARPAEPRGFGVLADADDDENDRNDVVGPRPLVRISNATAVARARRFLQFGDERFGEQEFSLALQRYKKAARAAPDLADAYFRQAMAHVALGRYAEAAAAVKRGLGLQPRWPAGEFHLDDIYADNRLAKIDHLERLAKAARQAPDRADLIFLVGVELMCDGQPVRAQVFFQQAADLGEDAGVLAGFLEQSR